MENNTPQNSPKAESPNAQRLDMAKETSTGSTGTQAPGNPGSGGAQNAGGTAQNSVEQKAPAAPLGFWKQRPVHKTDSPIPPSSLSKLYNALSLMPLLPLLGLLALSIIFSMGARELAYYGETLTAAALESFLQNPEPAVYTGHIPYLEMPPLYFAFVWGIKAILQASRIFSANTAQLLFLGTGISAALYLLGGQLLGRFVARVDGRALLGSGLMLLFSIPVLAFTHHTGAELFTAFCAILAQIFFYHAIVRPLAFVSFGLGFIFATASFLSGGLAGLVLPIVGGFLFALWRKTPARFFKLDFLVGLAIAFLIIGTWGVGISVQTDSLDYLEQFIFHALPTTILSAPLAAATFLLITALPWVLLLICTRWHGVFTKAFYTNLGNSQKPAGEGIAFLWCMVLVHVAALFVFGVKHSLYLLPAIPALSIIACRHLLRFTAWQATFTRYMLGCFFVIAGAAGIALVMVISGAMNAPDFLHLPAWRVHGTAFMYAAPMLFILLGACIILILRSPRPEGTLMLMAVFLTAFSFLLGRYVAPAFNPVLSPAHNASLIQLYTGQGYKALGDNADTLIYTYGSGSILTPLPAQPAELSAMVLSNTPFIADVSAKYIEGWTDRPMEIKEVGRQWLGNEEHILLAYPAWTGQAPEQTAPANDAAQTPESTTDQAPEQAPQPSGTMIEQDMDLPGATPGAVPSENTAPVTNPAQEAIQPPAQGAAQEQAAPAVQNQPAAEPLKDTTQGETPQTVVAPAANHQGSSTLPVEQAPQNTLQPQGAPTNTTPEQPAQPADTAPATAQE